MKMGKFFSKRYIKKNVKKRWYLAPMLLLLATPIKYPLIIGGISMMCNYFGCKNEKEYGKFQEDKKTYKTIDDTLLNDSLLKNKPKEDRNANPLNNSYESDYTFLDFHRNNL